MTPASAKIDSGKGKSAKKADKSKAKAKGLKAVPGQRRAPEQQAPDQQRADTAWQRLEEGNQRWASGLSGAALSRTPERRASLVQGQAPFAMVLGCADSRLPTELLFDQGLGDIFVVRTAGHAVDDAVLGSVEYAVAVLGVDLVVVLGHDSCGAVAATAKTLAQGTVPGGYIRDIVERLSCDIASGQQSGLTDLDDLSRYHARSTAELLQNRSSIVRDAVEKNGLGIVAATYELGSGRVRSVPA
ncbi:carbonic anhydrase [Kineosporia sp. NBRC 101731]|uniref:carbonic anhydrase n=1 Tax=Kineosporia sp. NBRC 101731 TaxID=3032199 RepID=UPI0024A0EFA3|nr:carbonic anhydrase [Kineosporia sp. NBRC 101731]GLY33240.1 carbonic anhydrase 2 [Kineosporia sp. NBRC 101731]